MPSVYEGWEELANILHNETGDMCNIVIERNGHKVRDIGVHPQFLKWLMSGQHRIGCTCPRCRPSPNGNKDLTTFPNMR